MPIDDQDDIETLVTKNELLKLQLLQAQEELAHYLQRDQSVGFQPLRGSVQSVSAGADETDLPHEGVDAGGAADFRGNWNLVRHVLATRFERSATTQSLEEIVRAAPEYTEQVERAIRAESAAALSQQELQQRTAQLTGVVEDSSRSLKDLENKLTALASNIEVSNRSLEERFEVLWSGVSSIEGNLSQTFDSKLQSSVKAMGRSIQAHLGELENSISKAGSSSITRITQVIEKLSSEQSDQVTLPVLEQRFDEVRDVITHLGASLNTDALAPLDAAQKQIEALRSDLSLAVKMQAVRDSDLKELQTRFAELGDAKAQQETLIVELRDKLAGATEYLKSLRDGRVPDDQLDSASALVSLLSSNR